MKTTFRLAVALVAAAFAIPALAFTNTVTGNLNVSATVKASCSMGTITALGFGNYDPAVAAAPVGTTIAFKCTKSTPWEVTLSHGVNYAAAGNQRAMANGTEYLTYELYTDSGATKIWSDTTGGANAVTGTGTPTAGNISVYGVIPAGQYVTPQLYQDTIVVTVNY